MWALFLMPIRAKQLFIRKHTTEMIPKYCISVGTCLSIETFLLQGDALPSARVHFWVRGSIALLSWAAKIVAIVFIPYFTLIWEGMSVLCPILLILHWVVMQWKTLFLFLPTKLAQLDVCLANPNRIDLSPAPRSVVLAFLWYYSSFAQVYDR